MYIKPEKKWLTRKEAAIYLTNIGCAISTYTLKNLASNNNAMGGPPFIRSSYRTVRYDKDDLDMWARKQIVKIF
jgi:hypothetical protein